MCNTMMAFKCPEPQHKKLKGRTAFLSRLFSISKLSLVSLFADTLRHK
ncbi:MAG: hypothetical protein ROZ36_19340 [Thermincola sp.]|jgi:hypothetical protein|nr:hypothetical protein [Thermincola sp.]